MARFLALGAGVISLSVHAGASGVLKSNLSNLRVTRALVSAAPLPAPESYRGEVRRALGFVPTPTGAALDTQLLQELNQNAMVYGVGLRPLAAYALLISPPRPESVAEAFERHSGIQEATTMIWRGRVAWLSGREGEALRDWRLAFGDVPGNRKRLAEALYIERFVPRAIAEVSDYVGGSQCGEDCQMESLEMLRYWILWEGRSVGEVRAMCDQILGTLRVPTLAPKSRSVVANILARRALTFENDFGEAARELSRATAVGDTAYTQAVEALLALQRGEDGVATAAARRSVASAGDDGHALVLVAQVFARMGRAEEARAALDLAEVRAPLLVEIVKSLR